MLEQVRRRGEADLGISLRSANPARSWSPPPSATPISRQSGFACATCPSGRPPCSRRSRLKEADTDAFAMCIKQIKFKPAAGGVPPLAASLDTIMESWSPAGVLTRRIGRPHPAFSTARSWILLLAMPSFVLSRRAKSDVRTKVGTNVTVMGFGGNSAMRILSRILLALLSAAGSYSCRRGLCPEPESRRNHERRPRSSPARMSVGGGRAVNICSQRAFRILTLSAQLAKRKSLCFLSQHCDQIIDLCERQMQPTSIESSTFTVIRKVDFGSPARK